jgi:diphthine-ammonia ligase
MKVAVMFSGGKDSVYATQYCKEQGWDIHALIAVKPKNTEAYLYHYATVEWTKLQAEALGIPLILVKTDKIGPTEEAEELRDVFKDLDIEAVVLGGVGLQETQIKEIARVAAEFDIQTIVSHGNYTSEQLLEEEVVNGLDIMITDVAAEGLGPEWLGKKLDKDSLEELKKASHIFGFDPLGEGGHFNTFVVDSPLFSKRVEFVTSKKIWDRETDSGYLDVKEAVLVDK